MAMLVHDGRLAGRVNVTLHSVNSKAVLVQ